MEDITKIGPVGLKGLKGVNSTDNQENFDFANQDWKPISSSSNNWLQSAMSLDDVYEYNTGQELGASQYDKGIYLQHELENIEDTRAKEQSAWSKWANSGVKMLGTFGTTFIDGTLGTLVGVGTGIANVIDDDENTTFISGMWDNAVTNLTQQASNYLEDNFKNYRTSWEQNAAWYERLGTANFWSEGVLKNMGFMMGTAASMVAFGGLGKLTGLSKQLDKLGKVGKAAGWTGRTLLSTVGESAIEAKNSMDASLRSIDLAEAQLYEDASKNLEERYQNDLALAQANPDESSRAFNTFLLEENYKKQRAELENSKKALEAEKKKALVTASNNIFLANMAFLAITNNINMGSLIRGGYNNSSDLLKHIRRQVDGQEVVDLNAFAKGILSGTASYTTEQIENLTGKTIGRGLLNMAAEGFQEGGQKVASTSNEMQAQAKLNKFVNSLKYTDDDGNVTPLFTHTLNPTVNEELADYVTALGHTFEEEFGTVASPGWEEVFIGAISSGIGTPTVRRSTSVQDGKVVQGPYKLGWTGNAFWEAQQEIVGDKPIIDEYVSQLNNYIQDPKMQEKIKAAVTSASINDKQTQALMNGDIAEYKNLELAQVVNSAIFFKNAGLMDDYMALYDNYEDSLSDEDLKELYALTYSPVSKDSPLSEQQEADIRNNIRQKAKSTKDKIEKVIDKYNWNYEHYSDKFADNYRDRAIQELTYIDSLSWDIARRIDEMNKEAESIQGDDQGSVQKRQSIEKSVRQLTNTKNSLDKRFREYTRNPKSLERQLQLWQDEYDKYQIGNNAEQTLERYKNATTIKDIWDIYRHTEDASRDKVFEEAKKKANPKIKALMQQFQDFSSDIELIEGMIERENSALPENIRDQINAYEKRWIRSIAEDIINDDSPSLTRQSIKDKIEEQINTISDRLDELVQEDENGNYYIEEKDNDEWNFLRMQRETFRNYYKQLDKLESTRNAGAASSEQENKEEPQEDEEPEEDNTLKTTIVKGIEIKHVENADSYPNDSTKLIKFKNNLNAYIQTEEIDFLKGIIEGIKDGVVVPTKIVGTLSDTIEDNWAELQEWYDKKYQQEEEGPKIEEKEDNTEEVAKSKDSLTGHVFEKYRFSELATNKRLVLNPSAQELNGRYKIQEFIDLYMNKLPAGTKVSYIHNPNYPNKIFLGIKLSDIPKSVGLDRNKVTVETTNEGDYVIVGTLGYDEKNNPGTAEQWSLINNILVEEFKNSGSTSQHFVGSKSNEIKGITGGQLVTKGLNQDTETSKSLEDLLLNSTSNPHGLSMSNLKFAVVEGTAENPKNKYVRVDLNDTLYDYKGRPGQVLLYVPDGLGNYVPTPIDPIFWKDIKDDNTGSWGTYLANLKASLLQEVRNGNKKEAIKKLAELRDMLIFGVGNNIFYNEDSNTLTYQVNGAEVFKIDDAPSFYKALDELNPRVNISLSVLRSNPSFYSRLLKTNLAILGTVGSQFYLYPVNNKGDMVKNQPSQTSSKPFVRRNTLSIIYYNDSQYKTDGTNIYDYKGNHLNDSKLEQEIESVLGIQNDVYPQTVVGGITYYETPTGVYIAKQKGYRKLTQQEESKYREKKQKQKLKEKQDDVIPPPPIDMAPIEDTLPEPQEGDIIPPVQEGTAAQQPKQNYNGEDANQLKAQKDLDNQKKNPIFASLRNRESRTRIVEAIQNAGYTGNLKTPADITSALQSLNVPIDNVSNIDDIIDIINNCR